MVVYLDREFYDSKCLINVELALDAQTHEFKRLNKSEFSIRSKISKIYV